MNAIRSAAGSGAKLWLYGGAQPNGPGTAHAQTLLAGPYVFGATLGPSASLTVPSVLTATCSTVAPVAGSVSGQPTWWRLTDSSGTDGGAGIVDGSAGTSNADLITGPVVAGVQLGIRSLVLNSFSVRATGTIAWTEAVDVASVVGQATTAPAGALNYVQMTDATYDVTGSLDGQTRYFANRPMQAAWRNQYGDWRDASNVAQGNAHYALSGSINGTGDVVLTGGGLASLVARLMIENTGIYLRTITGSLKVTGKANANGLGPRLHIVTTTGAFDPPCIVDSRPIETTPYGSGVAENYEYPGIIKFDLAGVTGSIQSTTTLTLNVRITYTTPATISANYVDPPALNSQPSGGTTGIAATVARDTDLLSHPSVLIYDNLVSKSYIQTNFLLYTGTAIRPNLTMDCDLFNWDQYGIAAARMWSAPPGGNPLVMSWHHWAEPIANSSSNYTAKPWQRAFGDGYTHLFFRYLMEIGTDVAAGMNNDGAKLPGMIGDYWWGNEAVTQPEPSAYARWEGRLYHADKSAAHPHYYHLGTYYYGVNNPGGSDQNQYGHDGKGNLHQDEWWSNVYLKAGRVYCIEQEVKLNTVSAAGTGTGYTVASNAAQGVTTVTVTGGSGTFLQNEGVVFGNDTFKLYVLTADMAGNVLSLPRGLEVAAPAGTTVVRGTAPANADGEMRTWVDGVLVHEKTGFRIRGEDRVRIQDVPWMNIYHGGLNSPLALFHYDIGGICVATQYIGPPKTLVTALQGTVQWTEAPDRHVALSGATALESIAAQSPGVWRELVSGNIGGVIASETQTGNYIPYCGAMPWNPVTKQIVIHGTDHGAGNSRIMHYRDADNTWEYLGLGILSMTHGYEATVVNPYTGDVYSHNPLSGQFYRWLDASNWTAGPLALGMYGSEISPCDCWWSGQDNLGLAKAQGMLVLHHSSNGQLHFWNPLQNSTIAPSPSFQTSADGSKWYILGGVMTASAGTQHRVMAYSAIHNCIVVGGGNNAVNSITALDRVDANLVVTHCPPAPIGFPGIFNGSQLVCDPVTGNFLLIGQGQVWELDPTGAMSWTKLGDMPAGMLNPGNNDANKGQTTVVSCSTYGVVIYIDSVRTRADPKTRMWVYKHA